MSQDEQTALNLAITGPSGLPQPVGDTCGSRLAPKTLWKRYWGETPNLITAIDTREPARFKRSAFWLSGQAPESGNHIPYWSAYEKSNR